MNNQRFSNYLRVATLVIAMCIVFIDTFIYYYNKAQATEQTTTALTPLVTAPSPTPITAASTSAQPTYRVISFNKLSDISNTGIEKAQQSFLKTTHSTSVKHIASYELKYEIYTEKGKWVSLTARVYIPTTEGTYPLFVFAPGTTGIADKCAPTLENVSIENLGNYQNHLIAQAAEGYVTAFSDYEGYNDPDTTEAYFIASSEARTLQGVVQSLVELKSTTDKLTTADTSTVFLSGYSQGGHAAVSAAREWNQLPGSIKLAGIVEFAGASNVEALFYDSPWLGSYLVQSYIDYYGSNLQAFNVLQSKWLEEMRVSNEKLCVNDANKYFPHARNAVYTPAFLDAIESNTWPESLDQWKKIIELNSPLHNIPSIPHLSIQGGSDPIVTAKTQTHNIETFCQQNHSVTYQEYPGINHYDIRKAGFELANQWMKDVLSNVPIPNSCPEL